MNSPYIATLRQNPGRRAVRVEFRHPLRPDPSNQGKPGRKVRKGLGTDRAAAEKLVVELNRLLADPTLHSPTLAAFKAALVRSEIRARSNAIRVGGDQRASQRHGCPVTIC